MKRLALPFLLTLILTACSTTAPSSQTPPVPATAVSSTPTPADDPALIPTLFPGTENSELTRIDEQGMVVVEVTPINLSTTTDTLEFDVVMNTHSVDLSMDLAALSTLSTDTGASVQATLWDAPRGGHHVEGKLIFPIIEDSRSILEGASTLTLTITDVDIPLRLFEWQLE